MRKIKDMKLNLNESQNERCEVSLENIEFKQIWKDEYLKTICLEK